MNVPRETFDAIMGQAEAKKPLAQVIAEAHENLTQYNDTPIVPEEGADPAALAEIYAAGPAVDSLNEILNRIERGELVPASTIIDQGAMKTEAEIRATLAERRAWLDENEDSGAAEVGVETGWEQALAWVLEEES